MSLFGREFHDYKCVSWDLQLTTVTGKTHNENLADMNHPGLTEGQEIIRPLDDPIKPTGHLQIMYGNLCPGGGVAKITGKEGETFTVSSTYFALLFTFCSLSDLYSFFSSLFRVLPGYTTTNNSCFVDLRTRKLSVVMW